MKFKCKMIDAIAMRDFTNVVTAISKMATLKECILQLSPNELCFTVFNDRIPVVWVELNKDYFFHEYTMEGVSEEYNKIYLECKIQMLTKSLSTLKASARSVKIKLSDKNHPCLTIEIELPSITTNSWQCVHDIPIRIIPRKEWPSYQLPIIPSVDISIALPPLKQFKHVVERMKNMSPQLIVKANNEGLLIITVETDYADVSTHFRGMKVFCKDDEEREDISACISCNKLYNIHAWDSIHPDTMKCHIIHDRMIHIELLLKDSIIINYFIPTNVRV